MRIVYLCIHPSCDCLKTDHFRLLHLFHRLMVLLAAEFQEQMPRNVAKLSSTSSNHGTKIIEMKRLTNDEFRIQIKIIIIQNL